MSGNFVDVWHGRIQPVVDTTAGSLAILSGPEKQKAQSFNNPLLRDRFILVRAILRQTLAKYLHIEPDKIVFETSVHGKPNLTCGTVHFNMSHTADYLIIAVADFADIGIDIEVIKPRSSLAGLAARCFSSQELQDWQQLPPGQRLEVFYRLWTKKEAFVKAVGRGIALGLEQCQVDLLPGGQLQAIPAEYGAADDWLVTELSIDSPTCAALVTGHREFSLRSLKLEAAA